MRAPVLAYGVADGGPASRRRSPRWPWLAVLLFAVVAVALVPSRGAVPPVVRGDDYPFRAWSPQQVDPWGFAARSCTSFVAWRLNEAAGRVEAPWAVDATHVGDHPIAGGLGDADVWDERAIDSGFRVDTSPRRGAVAQWDAGEAVGGSCLGHVAFVVDVYRDGTVLVEEYSRWTGYDARRTSAPRYLHLLDGT